MTYILIFVVILAAAAAVFFALGIDNTPEVTHYTVKTDNLTRGFRLALLADLHSCRYGDGQSELLTLIDGQAPDAVMLSGDIVDDRLPTETAAELLRALAQKYPCYYVTGNHELWREDVDDICESIAALGMTVLRGESTDFPWNGGTVRVCGLDYAPEGDEKFEQELAALDAERGEAFSILLSHSPRHINSCLNYGFDLILSGHMHGGQWRVPGIVNGLLSPPFELFPKYAGGKYDFEKTTLIVSRGLAKETTWVPRVYNRPEIVVIDVEAL